MNYDISIDDIPTAKIANAIKADRQKNILFRVGGGIGDIVCAEPTIRYAISNFGVDCQFSIYCEHYDLFQHLPLKARFPSSTAIGQSDYLILDTYPKGLLSQYINTMEMNGVDLSSICALRRQLPMKDRRIRLSHSPYPIPLGRFALVHPGKGWESKTFPSNWWDDLIGRLKRAGIKVFLIGNDTVRVNPEGCLDLRQKLSITELVYVMQEAAFLVSNDSGPIHIAAATATKCYFNPTCKAPEYLIHNNMMHARWGEPMWEYFKTMPNNLDYISADKVPAGKRIEDFLYDPGQLVDSIMNQQMELT